MAWEIVAIWAICIGTLLWFRHDERRIRSERLDRHARYFASAPAYRHQVAVPAAARVPTPPQAKAHQRYLDLLERTRRQKNSTEARL
ncbi:MAG: hypothetical protein KIS86_08780 [Devosia sp.]|nr:hypothetical protein [Devosia sp.]